MKVVDLSLDAVRITGKDLLVILSVAWACFELYSRLVALEAGVLEGRIAALNMELSYMEDRQRTEQEQRRYEAKRKLVEKLMLELEDLE